MNEQITKEFYDWLDTRPEIIQELGKKYPPWLDYKLNGKPCQLLSYCEDGTVTVNTSDIFGLVGYNVFGVNPEELIVEK